MRPGINADLNSHQETFEDAPELTVDDQETLPRSESTRSLTDRRQSNGSATTPRATHPPPLPSPLVDRRNEGMDDVSSPTDLSPLSETENTPKKKKAAKSPLLTAHRLSTTSLDDINLNGNKDDDSGQDSPLSESKPASPPPLPSRDLTSNQRSSIPPPIPAAINKNPPPTIQPAPPTRKLTSPFSWLSRNSSGGKDIKSPPSNASGFNRRNTGASVSTLGSTSEMLDADNASTSSRKTGRSSLKDQFKILRMRDEGVADNDQVSVASGRGSVGHGSPSSIPEEQEDGVLVSPPSASIHPPASPLPSTVNPNLAPGTVSGISASASDVSAPVDWELWQQVVNHGPEVLHGTNASELNAAIKRGIPQTIRGVIWQVLADSRNPELEEVYRELVARGTDKEKHMSIASTVNGSVTDKEKDLVASSRSSIRSEVSLAQSNTGTSSPSPSHEKDAERLAKEQAAAEAARKKKAKEDAAALQRLEKAIRRDLGSRTSYSKYFLSQGNQEGLFGLCKAYALYDEAVGYAQGVNFIAMPLLFNVSVNYLSWMADMVANSHSRWTRVKHSHFSSN